MGTTPLIHIFVRHSADCKYRGDEFEKRCRCRKHFRWTQGGKQHRRKANTRSWAEAEDQKRKLEDQLAGRIPSEATNEARMIADAVEVFKTDKQNQGVTDDVLNKYTRELDRLRIFAEARNVFTVVGLSRELLIDYRAEWDALYPSSNTRQMVQARLKNFLRFCFDSKWLDRVPRLSAIKAEEAPTMPLTSEEYAMLLKTIPKTFSGHHRYAPGKPTAVRALVQLMRWSGLAIRDAVTLRRDEIVFDKAKKLHRIVTSRQKTGTHVSVPIPQPVAKELLGVLNGNPVYVFWTGKGTETTCVSHWQEDFRKIFKAAGIVARGNMLSHRLRDTFAVDLLEQGVPLEEVSKLLGHESIKTTERHYSKWMKGRQDRLDSLVTATWATKRKS
ncbi:MAG: tyrosine-type recombinase/integrase [Candidatus Sulfotelmatobacter sp.]|jgi:integrase/recombinase XerD